MKESILKAADVLKARGAEVEYFDLDLIDYAIPVTTLLHPLRQAPTWNASTA